MLADKGKTFHLFFVLFITVLLRNLLPLLILCMWSCRQAVRNWQHSSDYDSRQSKIFKIQTQQNEPRCPPQRNPRPKQASPFAFEALVKRLKKDANTHVTWPEFLRFYDAERGTGQAITILRQKIQEAEDAASGGPDPNANHIPNGVF